MKVMDDNQITVVNFDEWDGVYVNGSYHTEYQGLRPRDLVKVMRAKNTFQVEFVELTDPESVALVENDGFPGSLATLNL